MKLDRNRRSKDDRKLTGKITRNIEKIMSDRVAKDGGTLYVLKNSKVETRDIKKSKGKTMKVKKMK